MQKRVLMNIIIPWNQDYEEYLHDESRRIGRADSISFPTSEDQVIQVINEVRANAGGITTQGGRTGIVAGAVPDGGHVMNLSRMKTTGPIYEDSVSGEHRMRVQPGVLLSEIREAISGSNLFFPPDPTETSASIGGMTACNASGAMSFHYGPTRNWVESVRMVLGDGSVIALKRGQAKAQGRSFALFTENGREINGNLPSYVMPGVKAAAGYYAADDMDMLDLLIGMEGTLGIITEIELKLIPKPQAIAGLMVFLPNEEAALQFVRAARGEAVKGLDSLQTRPAAIEYFNSNALNLLRDMKSMNSAFQKIPALKPHYHTAVYIEYHADSDDELEEPVMQVMETIFALDGSDEDTWYATTERELEPLKAFRHATPEAVNLLIDQRKRECKELTKLGTDMSVPDEYLEPVIAMYDQGLKEQGLESVMFGHIGNNHVHVNILPHNMEEYSHGKSLYLKWAEKIVAQGGCVSAEHGIGKIKTSFLKMMYGEEGIEQMRALKTLFDPDILLNPGDLF
ncbi:MAG TPA: FAD-binding oxidoreductase [Armatimonadota bacterium]|nr:FAD-binding oxidoreductase [Armatimonadota bacterium]